MKLFIGKNISCDVHYDYNLAILDLRNKIEFTNNPSEADIILFTSTCSGSESILRETLIYIEYILKQKKDDAITIITGCITRKFLNNEFNNKIQKFLNKKFDYVIPENNISKVLHIITSEIEENNEYGICIECDKQANYYIQNGCTNKCSFCKATYQNLKPVSCDFDEIKESLLNLKNDIKIVNLNGMNICQYGLDLYGTRRLTELIDYIEKLDNIEEINLLGFTFKDAINYNFADSFRSSKKTNIIIGSLESASNRILKLMNKGFKIEEFIYFYNYIQELYKKKFVLDIIAGFPTETKEEMSYTIETLKRLKPYSVHIHKYDNSKMIPASMYEQLEKEELDYHYETYKLELKKEGIKVTANNG